MTNSRNTRSQTSKPSGGPTRGLRPMPAGGRRQHTRELEPDRPILVLAGIGMLITLYLSSVALWGSTPAFCTAGAGCDVILQSQWSKVIGIPLALWGFFAYALIALIAWRMPAGVRRWRRLWTLTLVGVVFSIYLTVLGIVAHQAVCLWCLSSFATMIALFAVVAVRRPDAAPGMPWKAWGLNTGAVALAALGVLYLLHHGLDVGRENPRLHALAVHLEETGARFYGASWCPHCQQQKREFGKSASYLPYVECEPTRGTITAVCRNNGITGYPTWVIGGQTFNGVLAPEQLAALSGFDWSGFTVP